MNLLLLARSARVHSVRNCISFDPNVFFPFLYRNNLKCSGCLLCENTELHFRKGIVLEKKHSEMAKGQLCNTREFHKSERVSVTRRQAQLTTLDSSMLWDYPVCSGASQCLLCDGYNATVRKFAGRGCCFSDMIFMCKTR